MDAIPPGVLPDEPVQSKAINEPFRAGARAVGEWRSVNPEGWRSSPLTIPNSSLGGFHSNNGGIAARSYPVLSLSRWAPGTDSFNKEPFAGPVTFSPNCPAFMTSSDNPLCRPTSIDYRGSDRPRGATFDTPVRPDRASAAVPTRPTARRPDHSTPLAPTADAAG
ncbi:MAG: hypothetical protein JWQ69_3080 [Pseudomonas sp.]|nr:hypothetical protein [Pseudomonas sp.]